MSGRELILVAAAWLAIAVPASAEKEMASHGDHAMHPAESDPHAGHRAAMKSDRYTVRNESYAVPNVDLLDQAGTIVPLQSLLDSSRPVALNFIFTTCTTICPVMTVTFAQMQRQLGDTADDLQLVSISIDPEFDRPAVLDTYARQFRAGDNWQFLTGDSDDILEVLIGFDAYAGSKMNHQPATFLLPKHSESWTRIDGLASGADLAQEVSARLLN